MYKTLGPFITIDKTGIEPNKYPHELFDYFSLPAYDSGKSQETVFGSEIDSNKFLIKANTILVSKLNPRTKRVWLVTGNFTKRIVASTEFIPIVCDEGVNTEFLAQSMLQDDVYSVFQANAVGTTNSHVRFSPSLVEKIELFIPAIIEQQKIAKILATVDNLIEQTQNIIDKYTAVKQGMMADLFSRGIDLSGTPETNKSYGQLRPSYEEAPELYQETELGWVPIDWDVRPVENVSIGGFKNGYFKDPKLVGSGKKLINVTELYQDFGIDITTDKVERITVSPKDFEKYKVDIGDLFFTRSSLVLEGIAKSNIVRNLPEEAVFECHVMRLKPNKEVVVPEFLALFTGMPKARSYLMSMAKQVTMTTIAQPDMVGLPTPVPSLNEQQAIVEKIDAIDELIRKEKETVEKNKNIKKGLMQDLLTGKVKVS